MTVSVLGGVGVAEAIVEVVSVSVAVGVGGGGGGVLVWVIERGEELFAKWLQSVREREEKGEK